MYISVIILELNKCILFRLLKAMQLSNPILL